MSLPAGLDANHYSIVSAMITPAFFLTATASLLASSNARLSRVVDRMRADLRDLKQLPHGSERSELDQRIAVHRIRSRLVLAALRLLYGALSAFVATSLAIAADTFTRFRIDLLPTGLAVIGVLLVFAASLCLGREASLSLRLLDTEIDLQMTRDQQR